MERFIEELVVSLEKKSVRNIVLVHQHPGFKGKTPATENDSGIEQTFCLYRATTLGTVAFTPISLHFPLLLFRILREYKPDILHIHLPNVSALWLLIFGIARRVPWVIHWHSDVVPSRHSKRLRYLYPMYRQVERLLLKKSNRIISTSQNYLDNSTALQPFLNKSDVIPLGMCTQRTPVSTQCGAENLSPHWWDAKFRFLSIGRLTYYKGMEVLIQAVAHVPNATLAIVGSGELQDSLRRLVAKLGLGNRVCLMGSVTEEQKNALLARCHCVCLSSLEKTEAFGMVLLEAMVYEKPAIACDIPGSGVPWVVANGKTGILVKPGDIAELAQAIRRIIDDADNLGEMGSEASKRLVEEFSIEHVACKTSTLYDTLLGNQVRIKKQKP